VAGDRLPEDPRARLNFPGYFVADVPELPGRHTQAKSLDALMNRVKEAIALCMMPGPA